MTNSLRIHAGLLATTAGCVKNAKPRIKPGTVNVAIGRSTNLPEPCSFYATPDMDAYAFDCMYDPKRISLADAEQWVRTQLAEQGLRVARFINEDAALDDDARITHQAAAIYLANELYGQALTSDNPAATLDDIADVLPELLPAVFKTLGTDKKLAAALLPEVADRVWAFTVVAHAKAEADPGYGYVFDILAENVRHGRAPQAVRDEVPRVVAKLRSSRIVGRLWEARDAADGPWAQMLDILLAEIDKGADPQAVVDQALGLMQQAGGSR